MSAEFEGDSARDTRNEVSSKPAVTDRRYSYRLCLEAIISSNSAAAFSMSV